MLSMMFIFLTIDFDSYDVAIDHMSVDVDIDDDVFVDFTTVYIFCLC